MKIVVDARESGTTTGRYVDKLIEYLHQLKPAHELIVLTKKERLDFFKTLAPSFQVVETPYREFTFGEQLGLLKQLQSLKADLVHFPMTQQPIFYRGRVVTSILDLTTCRFRNPAKNPLFFWLKQRVYIFVTKYVARKSKAIITISDYVKKDLAAFARIPETKITTTYLAADHIAEQGEPVAGLESTSFIMYVGRPLPHKNLERLIDAFAMLKQHHPDLKLVLAGKKESLFERIEQNTNKKGITNVIFTGFISEGGLRWLYEHTAAYVFPSLSEGFGLPGLEAMIHGAPVVSSNATCLPEIYGKAAHFFDPTDTEGMAVAIEEVISNSVLRQELIAKGARQAAAYSWQTTALRTFDIYNSILQK